MVSLLCNMALYIEGFMVNSVYLHKYVYLEMVCDLKYSALTFSNHIAFSSVQFSSVAQSCLTLCDPVDCSIPGFSVHHQLPEPAQAHVH